MKSLRRETSRQSTHL